MDIAVHSVDDTCSTFDTRRARGVHRTLPSRNSSTVGAGTTTFDRCGVVPTTATSSVAGHVTIKQAANGCDGPTQSTSIVRACAAQRAWS